MHAFHRRRQGGVGLQREARREAGGAQHAEGVVAERDLRVERRAQTAGRQVPQPVEGVDQLHVGQPERERVHGEVAARQVHRQVLPEGDLGLARVGHVDLGPVRRDLVVLRALAAADGPEALALRPDGVGPTPHQALGLSRKGIGGEVEVVRRGRAGGPGEQGVAHGSAHQGEAVTGRGEAARHLFGGLDVGAEPFGDGRGLHPPTVVRPLASPCVDAAGPGPPSARSRWPSQPWSAPWAPPPQEERSRRAPVGRRSCWFPRHRG